jgi:uncharacterized protein with PIN domain
MKEAAELREKWGGKPCEHPNLDKEYELGTATGDYVCTTCGKAGWGRDWADIERKESKK